MKTQGKAGVQQILVSFSATVFALVLGMLLIYAIGLILFRLQYRWSRVHSEVKTLLAKRL